MKQDRTAETTTERFPTVGESPRPSSQKRDHPIVDSRLPEMVVVYDAPQACPYLEGQVARMPLHYPRGPLSPEKLDRLLNAGFRRTGAMFYRTQCPRCRECIPARVDVTQFQVSRSMRRILNRAARELTIEIQEPRLDANRLAIFNDHRIQRDLSRHGAASLEDYYEFLVATSVDTLEMSFWSAEELIGIAIFDVGAKSLNAVYTHFSPNQGRFSIGTLAVLKQIEFAIAREKTHLYLGLFVAENVHLNYKRRFRPQQRLVDGQWKVFED